MKPKTHEITDEELETVALEVNLDMEMGKDKEAIKKLRKLIVDALNEKMERDAK